MLSNYLKIALRNLSRHKGYSAINIIGFALGIACCLVILLWVRQEWSVNRFHTKLDRIHRVLRVQQIEGQPTVVSAAISGAFADAAKANIPQIESLAQVMAEENVFTDGNNIFREEGVFTHSEAFSLFDFPLAAGNATTMLDEPNSLALSESLARKLFADTPVHSLIGKTVRLDAAVDCKITAIFLDIPRHSSLRFEYALPLKHYVRNNAWAQRWDNSAFRTYFLLREGVSVGSVDAVLKDFLAEKGNLRDGQTLITQPFADMHLYSRFENGVLVGGRIETVRMFLAIAALVLALACMNFTNLTTARGVRRSKEFGIRKSVGARRSQLAAQIVGESVLMAFAALPLALLIVELALPALRNLLGEQFGDQLQIPFVEPQFWLGLLVFGGVIGVIAGAYPAFALSSFATSSVLKGTLQSGPRAVLLRRTLVVGEFAVAVMFIAGTIVMYRQIEFIKTKNLGLQRENVVSFPVNLSSERFATWKAELLSEKAILSVSGGGSPSPVHVRSSTSAMHWKGQAPNEKMNVFHLHGDEDFLTTMGIVIKAGRGFSPKFAADTANYIINETCARQMRLENPVGETLRWGNGANALSGTIVGVVQDFHFASMHDAIEPMMFTYGDLPDRVFVRFAAGRVEEGLNALRRTYPKYQPGLPLDYKFLDEQFDEIYTSETMIGRLAFVFAGLAVMICCLGLFGLAAFMAESRTKEIGIRKVLGASVAGIVTLLSADFLKLIVVAIILATPLAYWVMGAWLRDFAYRVDLSWWVFASAGLVAVLIAFLTVASQAWRAAEANPIESLRSE